MVAACLRAGIGYTLMWPTALALVAACLRAGIGYTIPGSSGGAVVAACLRAGIGYTDFCLANSGELRLACGRGSDTLPAVAASHLCCGLLAGGDRIHSVASRCIRKVAACLRAGIGYTIGIALPTCALRLACGRGSDTLPIEKRPNMLLRLACGRGSDTLTRNHSRAHRLRLACGRGSDTLVLIGFHRVLLMLRLACGRGSDTLPSADPR